MQTISVDPVTRVEGHGKVVIELDDAGKVEKATFSVMEFRGFEKFCEGRMIWDMPSITSRICGFCPVSHHLAAVKATEDLLGVEPPEAAKKLRELMHMGQVIQSHALHFFFCGMPDFLGELKEPAKRSVFGMLDSHKRTAQAAIKLRKVGQDIVDQVGGGRLHPVSCLPGGMAMPLEVADRVVLLTGLAEGVKIAEWAVQTVRELCERNRRCSRASPTSPAITWDWLAKTAPWSCTTVRSAWPIRGAAPSSNGGPRSTWISSKSTSTSAAGPRPSGRKRQRAGQRQAQPPGGGHPLLRSLPLVLHPRLGPDAPGGEPRAPRRRGGGSRLARGEALSTPAARDDLYVVGIGHPLRGDDRVGPVLFERLTSTSGQACTATSSTSWTRRWPTPSATTPSS